MNIPSPSAPSTVPPKKSGGCIKGCLITLAILLILSGIAAYFVVKNLGPMTRNFSSSAIEKISDDILKDAELPAEEKARINGVVKGFTAKIRNGEVGLQQGIKVMESLVQGPFLGFIMASAFDASYLTGSSLPAEEIQAGRVTVGRFTQGVMQQSIPEAESDPVFNLFTEKKDEGGKNRTLKKHLSDEEVRAVLAQMKAAADRANIPAVPSRIDIANELQHAIDAGMSATAP